jgi:hypothetical protein
MTLHAMRRRLHWVALALGWASGLLISQPALAQVPPLTPFPTFSLKATASGSELNQTSAADYTVQFTLAPDVKLDPTTADVLLRVETAADDPEPCFIIAMPKGCLVPTGPGSFHVPFPANCGVQVLEEKPAFNYARDLTPLLQDFTATLQEVKGEWQARIVTTFTEAVAYPDPCGITFRIDTNGITDALVRSSDTPFRAVQ